jgi:hypothetical protein
MELSLEYVTLDGDIEFDIMNKTTKVGELTISNNYDCYIVSAKAKSNFHIINKGKVDDNLELLFNDLMNFIRKHPELMDINEKPIILLEDETIVNRYAIVNSLNRVPRFCGFYLNK